MSNLTVFCFFNLPDLEYHPLGYSAAWLKLPDFVPSYHLKSCSFSNAICWRNARLIVTKIYRKNITKQKWKFIFFYFFHSIRSGVRPFAQRLSLMTLSSPVLILAIDLLPFFCCFHMREGVQTSQIVSSRGESNRVDSNRVGEYCFGNWRRWR